MATSLIGQTVGRYKVVGELGRGQHSVVYKAWQQSLQRHVALKVLHHYDQETLRKFQAEARLIASLTQQGVPNIRQVYEVGQTPDGYLFVAQEYVEDSLRNVMQRVKKRNRRMNPAAAARLLKPIAEALDSIHSLGWVHLDIKPQNVLVCKGGRTVLADFGIAQRRGMLTHACTPTYASPEQAAGDRPVGPWSDVYSLGVVLYEMVAGHPPVRGDHDIVLLNQHLEVMPPSPRKVNPMISADQERAILKALAKSPKQRFPTASDLVQAMLSPEAAPSSVIKTPRLTSRGTSRWGRRKPRPALVGGILVLLLILSLVLWALRAGLPFGAPTATNTATAIRVTSQPAISATTARWPTVVMTPTPTGPPTVTLAPTPTRTPRPTRRPTATPTATP